MMEPKAKYDRQLIQGTLEEASICLLNCGPIGSNALKNLVLGGVGSITIVEGSKVLIGDIWKQFHRHAIEQKFSISEGFRDENNTVFQRREQHSVFQRQLEQNRIAGQTVRPMDIARRIWASIGRMWSLADRTTTYGKEARAITDPPFGRVLARLTSLVDRHLDFRRLCDI
ncbi:unnamed protein product [Arabidopsis thaliana]|uniref:Uncharacterized protein n=1 Tax=Arabidopsis thaliana TaxID=3702 RepID=A0A654FAW9_ARATH|nr:unnamed protein product [Arabidopsis thaliana]